MPIEHRREDEIAVVALAHPPVNAFGLRLRCELVETFARLAADDRVRGIVVHGAGQGFSAGGDRTEFGKPAAAARPTLSRDVLSALESCGKPVVAAIHGFAIGGGLEFALTCDARVATADSRVGLPEVTLGRFPLSGTQRLPRLLGVAVAAEWILRGETVQASSPAIAPVFDRIVADPDDLLPVALDTARTLMRSPRNRVRDRPFPDADPRASLRQVLRQHPAETCTAPQRAALEALQAAVEAVDFQAGLDRAQVLFDELVA